MGKYAGQIESIEAHPKGPWTRVTLASGKRFYMHEAEVARLLDKFGGLPSQPLYFATSRFMDKVQWWGDEADLRSAMRLGVIDGSGNLTGRMPDIPSRLTSYLSNLAALTNEQWLDLVKAFLAQRPSEQLLDAFERGTAKVIREGDPNETDGLEAATRQASEIARSVFPGDDEMSPSYVSAKNASSYVANAGLLVTYAPEAFDADVMALVRATFHGVMSL